MATKLPIKVMAMTNKTVITQFPHQYVNWFKIGVQHSH